MRFKFNEHKSDGSVESRFIDWNLGHQLSVSTDGDEDITSFQFDIKAPDFNEAIPLTVFYSINDMFGDTKNFTIASFTDLPDLFIEEVIVSDNILEGEVVPITARVVNQGPGPARDYQLNFYNNEELFGSVRVEDRLNSNEALDGNTKTFSNEA